MGISWDPHSWPVIGGALNAVDPGAATVQGPPGLVTAGPGPNVRHNPDGTVTDLATGQTYINGTPVANPNLAQQAGTAADTSANLLNQLAGYNQQYQQTFGQEQGLAGDLNRTILGGGPPSAAEAQLTAGLGDINAAQLATAAGASGASAPLASLMAARNAGAASIGTNQTAALIRAKQIADAQNAYAALLNSMAAGSRQAYGQTLGGAEDYAHQALQGETNREDLTEKAREATVGAQQKQGQNILSGLSGAAQNAGLLGGGGGAGGGAGAAALAA